jgi:hypothetical protein
MVINAVLLAVRRIVHNVQPNLNVAIIPEIKMDSNDGTQINSPISGYELLLTGTFDNAVVQHTNEEDTKSKTQVISYNLLGLLIF